MNGRTNSIIISVLLLCVVSISAAQVMKGDVTEVTVYRDQALVTRTLKCEGVKGAMEMVVTGLPLQIVPASLSAESLGGSTIHSVTYRTKAISGELHPKVKELDDKIKKLEKQLREVIEYQHVRNHKVELMGKLEDFTVGTAKLEIQKGVLNFEELKGLTEYALGKHDELAQTNLALIERREVIEEELNLLRRQRAEITKDVSLTEREALIYLTKEREEAVDINLRYLVKQVSWYPQYNLRAGAERDAVNIEYNGLVRQMSGEDWMDVNLRLSTAQPTFTAEPPLIEPLEVTLGPKVVLREAEIRSKLQQVEAGRKAGYQAQYQFPESPASVSSFFNLAASEEQVLELTAGEDFLRTQRRELRRLEGVSVTYELSQEMSLESRTDEQIMQIARLSVPGEFVHKAAPVLTEYVYEEGKFKNTSGYMLLPGEYNSYLNGEFMGRGRIEMVASGGGFKAGFGVNAQVRIDKELMSRDERIVGGNLVSEVAYKFTITNYSDKVLDLELEDRLPYSPDGSVQVELIESEPEIIKDEEYRRTGYRKGLLKWRLEIPAEAKDEGAVEVSYRFRMAHEKNLTIKGMEQKGM